MKNCCSATNKSKKCFRKTDKKVFTLPRRFSKKKCLMNKIKGFTMRSSCAPYKNCKKLKGGARNYGARTISSNTIPAPITPDMSTILQHNIEETEVGGLINAFMRSYVEIPITGDRSVSPNTFHDMANDLINIIGDIYETSFIINREVFMDVTPYYLINGLLKLTRSPRQLENTLAMIPTVRRGDFIHELNRIRNEMITRLASTGYPIETLRGPPIYLNIEPDYYDINTSAMEPARLSPINTEYDTSASFIDIEDNDNNTFSSSSSSDDSYDFDEDSVLSDIPQDTSIHELDEEPNDQLNLFNNECEGMCGV